jgi:hypothetical protein
MHGATIKTLVQFYMATKFILALSERNLDNVILKVSVSGVLRKTHGPEKDEGLLNGWNC